MDLSDSPGGPACPSRASGWDTHPPPGVSRVASVLPVQTCRRHYPGGIVAGIGLLPGGDDGGLPQMSAGSAPALTVSRPARRSLTLRPVCSRSRLATLCIEGSGSVVTSAAAPIATGWSNSCQVGLAPTEERHLYTAHGHRGLFLNNPRCPRSPRSPPSAPILPG